MKQGRTPTLKLNTQSQHIHLSTFLLHSSSLFISQMSSNVDKVKVILRFNGEWVEGNEGWDYVCIAQTVEHRVKLYSNCTHQHLLDYV